MTQELTIHNAGEVADRAEREALLQKLEDDALAAASPEEAHAAQQRALFIKDALVRARQPYEDAWRAGKASVLASRKLGALLTELSPESRGRPGQLGGSRLSERGAVRKELGLVYTVASNIIRLAAIPDPEFQRYIQSTGRIPSVPGALTNCRVVTRTRPAPGNSGGWHHARRKKLGVKSPANPSLDEAGSLIVKALGHLGTNRPAGVKQATARSHAMDLLYQAHDLIRPYLGGYVE
jgi:hypothetical protein